MVARAGGPETPRPGAAWSLAPGPGDTATPAAAGVAIIVAWE